MQRRTAIQLFDRLFSGEYTQLRTLVLEENLLSWWIQAVVSVPLELLGASVAGFGCSDIGKVTDDEATLEFCIVL